MAPIVYEVNVEVSPDRRDEYLSWLPGHVSRLLQVEGFTRATLYTEVTDGTIVVHYFVKSREALESYFSLQAPALRLEATQKFGDSIRFRRRILGEISA